MYVSKKEKYFPTKIIHCPGKYFQCNFSKIILKFAINIFVSHQWLKKTNGIQPYATFTLQIKRIPYTNLNKMY